MTTIAAGTKLGVYEVVGPIGSGGMGTVYRTRDTRLPREAAIKGISMNARWSADGRQLIFVKANTLEMQTVDVDTSKGFQAGNPRRLFAAPPPLIGVNWTLSPDGKRFLFATTPNGGRTAPFTVVLNWPAALRK